RGKAGVSEGRPLVLAVMGREKFCFQAVVERKPNRGRRGLALNKLGLLGSRNALFGNGFLCSGAGHLAASSDLEWLPDARRGATPPKYRRAAQQKRVPEPAISGPNRAVPARVKAAILRPPRRLRASGAASPWGRRHRA